MNNFNFGEVLTRAWKIIWKHKILWIFGILASCARGGGGASGSGGNSGYRTGSGGNPNITEQQIFKVMQQFGEWILGHLWIIIAVIAGLFLLSLVFYLAGIMGRIGLIKGAAQADKGAEHLAFGEIWSESMPFFWRIFGINFLFGLAFFILLVPLILFGIITIGVGFLCIIPILCILVPLSWVVMVIIELAQNAIVLEDLGMLDGFKRGWEIVKANAVSIVIMALILVFGGGIIGVILALPLIIAVIPIFIGVAASQQSLIPLYIALACCAVYYPILIFLNGVLTAYIQSAWTLTYLRLARPKEEAPVIIEANA